MRSEENTLTENLIERILAYIRKNHLKPGDPLPTEQEMIRLFGISRVALREAFCYLKGLGIIVSRRGSCLRVGNPSASKVLEKVISGISLPESDIVIELFELRRMLELGAAADAVEKASRSDLDAIEKAQKEFETLARAATPDPLKLDAAEIKFHCALFAPAGCRILGVINTALREFFLLKTEHHQGDGWYTEKHLEQLCREHAKIAEAFQNRSPEQAFTALRNHLEPNTYQIDPKS